MRTRTTILTALVAMVALVAGAWLNTAQGSPEEAPLDDIPGLASTFEAGLRDDIIAYWESWRRSVHVRECMDDAGFAWEMEADFPDGAVLQVANSLDVDYTSARAVDPDEANRDYQNSLSDAERDRYFMALYGETAHAIEHVRENEGRLPPGERDDRFATGGCKGEALDDVGSIWALRENLHAEVAEMREAARGTRAFRQRRDDYAACLEAAGFVVSSPGEVEELAREARSPQESSQIQDAERRCHSHWRHAWLDGLESVADGFREEHRTAIDRQKNRYRGTLERVRQDQEFLKHVEEAASRIAATGQAHG